MSKFPINPNVTNKGTDIDFSQLLRILNKWKKLIVGLTLVITIFTALINHYYLTPIYEAKTLLMVTVASDKLQTQTSVTRQITQNSKGETVTNLSAMPVLTMNTYLGQLTSGAVMTRVVDKLNLPGMTSERLANNVDAAIVPDSNLIEVKIRSSNPDRAALMANTVVEQYLALMNELMLSSVVVISPANTPTIPIAPNKNLNTSLGFLLGLMIAVLMGIVLDYMDNTLKNSDDINRELNLSVLGLIPAKTNHNTRQSR